MKKNKLLIIALVACVFAVPILVGAAGDMLDGAFMPSTLTGTYTFEGSNTHSGTNTFSGTNSFTGNVTLGNATTDTITLTGQIVKLSLGVTALTSANTPYAVTATDTVLVCDTSGGGIEIDLPAVASNEGRVLTIMRDTSAGTNAVTIDPNASETLDGSSSSDTTIDATGDSITILSDGTEWLIIGSEID